ncbi:MAG: tetratricopeptide repeat protein [Prolixibacteraceae bacterium]|jgi:tetratricopeptide (TPR) repeat protein|nr:tetratricopeptide repeat protein [Prolixibacteraceae bacterium]MDI9564576.1 tetratricopeptide repeat protein [Bacteroidota bacterium]NLT00632.1 tetratricopeptide repeat protein [Bacteroidales bacterium]OQB79985.1 MAG: Tetratricopeptide repeat protein [Bacteroidetes bacterium ADurb.Bin123]HNZ68287.1 tetratricopeptide repeat protein [Prolixibacteraceae bacterium]
MAKKKTTQHDNLQNIESALTKTEQFIEDNQNLFLYIIGGIVLVVVGYLAITRFYIQPRQKEAQSQMFMAEQYFEKDSFNLALNGDGNYLGFLDIMDEYGITRQAKLSRYYAGISYLRLGQFSEAVDYLNRFKTKDILLGPVSRGALGDAYLELGEQEKALKLYEKAATMSDNEMTAPIYLMKAGNLLESMGHPEAALKHYNNVKKKYPDTMEGRMIDKYISRVSAKK